MITQLEKKHYTLEEYFELELTSETRSEYRNGEISSMTGGTPDHNDIAGNLYILLKLALKGKNHRTFYTDQRLWVPDRTLAAYSDIMVVEKPLQLQAGRTDTVINPCFIVEVLSRSTQDYDRGDKFVAYRTIESFREYLLIDQYRVHVEHYVKTAAHQWLLSEYDEPTVTLSFSTFEFQIQIADLYENIEFETPQLKSLKTISSSSKAKFRLYNRAHSNLLNWQCLKSLGFTVRASGLIGND